MKLFSKLILISLLLGSTQAREVIILSYSPKAQNAKFLADEIMKRIPSQLVTISKEVNPCTDKYPEAILHLCLRSDGELVVVRDNKDATNSVF
jgi:hypothetical protein